MTRRGRHRAHHPLSKGRWLILLVAGAIAVTISACGSSSGASSGGGSQLVIGRPSLPSNIDPGNYDGLPHAETQFMFESSLLRFRPLPADAKRLGSLSDVEPSLAKSFKVTKSGMDITLRGTKSQAGNPLTSEDVAWSFERLFALKYPLPTLEAELAGIDLKNPVTVIDENRLRINGDLTPIAPAIVADTNFSILDKALVEKSAGKGDPWGKQWLQTNSASFGAYGVDSFTPSQSAVLSANPNYYDGAPGYPNLQMQVTDAATEVALLKTGDIQLAIGLPYDSWDALSGDSGIKTVAAPSFTIEELELYRSFKPFNDQKVREAVSLSIDRKPLISGPYRNAGTATFSPVAPSIPGVKAPPIPETNVTKAKELLKEAGYPDGFTFTLALSQPETRGVNVQSMGVFLKSQLAKAGLNAELEIVPSSTEFTANTQAQKYDSTYRLIGPIIPDPLYVMSQWHATGSTTNRTQESVPEIDKLVAEATPLPLGPKRDELTNQMINVFAKQTVDVPVAQPSIDFALAGSVCGFLPSTSQKLEAWKLRPCK